MEDVTPSADAAPESAQAPAEATAPAESPTSASTSAAATDAAGEASANEFDLGWSLDTGEGEAESPAETDIPDTDDDLQAQDGRQLPSVEQLVESLRTTRQNARDYKRQLREAGELAGKVNEVGGWETVEQTLNLARTFLYGAEEQPDSTVPFLNSLYQTSTARYEQLVKDVAAAHPDFLIGQLQAQGKLPAFDAGQQAAPVAEADLADIPEHLRDTYKALPQAVREELAYLSPEARDYNLEREHRLRQLDAAQQAQERQQMQAQYQAAERQGEEAVQQLSRQYTDATYRELGKFQPYGPDAPDKNRTVHREMVEGAWSELLEDPKFAQMHVDLSAKLRNAPVRALRGEQAQAADDERSARQMAMQLNARFGQLLAARVKERNQVYADARAYRAMMAAQGQPQRQEIPGSGYAAAGGHSQANGAIKRQPGETMNAYLERLAAKHAGQAG